MHKQHKFIQQTSNDTREYRGIFLRIVLKIYLKIFAMSWCLCLLILFSLLSLLRFYSVGKKKDKCWWSFNSAFLERWLVWCTPKPVYHLSGDITSQIACSVLDRTSHRTSRFLPVYFCLDELELWTRMESSPLSILSNLMTVMHSLYAFSLIYILTNKCSRRTYSTDISKKPSTISMHSIINMSETTPTFIRVWPTAWHVLALDSSPDECIIVFHFLMSNSNRPEMLCIYWKANTAGALRGETHTKTGTLLEWCSWQTSTQKTKQVAKPRRIS